MAPQNQRRQTAGFLCVVPWMMTTTMFLLIIVRSVVSCHFQGNHVSYGRRMLQAIDPETCNGLLDEYSLITSVDGDLCTCSTTTGGNVELSCEPVNQDDSRGCVFSSNLVFIDLFDTVQQKFRVFASTVFEIQKSYHLKLSIQ